MCHMCIIRVSKIDPRSVEAKIFLFWETCSSFMARVVRVASECWTLTHVGHYNTPYPNGVYTSYDVIEGYGDNNDLPWMLFVDGYFMKILMTNVLMHLTE